MNHTTDRLDSWKEIARYLGRDESTVQRWEKREGMPVHRHLHAKRGSVYAYPAELEAWWQGRRQQLDAATSHDGASAPDAHSAAAVPLSGSAPRRTRWLLAGITAAAVVVIAFVSASRLARWSSPQPTSRGLVRLTSTSGMNIDPALSPDGSLLAYASDRSGSGELDIWLQPVGEGQPRQLTGEPGDELEPSFSPDGELIAYARGEGGGIYVIEAAGGTPRPVVTTARARAPRFSPNGQWLTYWTGLPLWGVPGPVRATGALFVVPAGGGSPRQLVPDFAQARCGTWAPDSDTVLFLGAREHDPMQTSLDWYVVSLAGGAPVRTGAMTVLRRAGVKGVAIPGAWSADGVVTFATSDEGASHVWQLAVSAATGRVAGEPVRLTFGTAVERSPAIGPSGRVVFTSIGENVDVWRLPLDPKTGLAHGPIERVTDNAASDRLWQLSADGGTMALVSSRSGQDEVWIKDLHTGHERQITHSNARGARISPDGSMLAIIRGLSPTSGVDLVPVSGLSPPSPLCDDCVAGDWSPDGAGLLVQRGTPTRLLIRELPSGREAALASHTVWSLYQPRYSPDGRWVVFHTTNTPSLRQIYVVPAFADGPVPVDDWIPVVPDFGVQPSWATDGSGIYHFSLRDGAFCAWLQPVDAASKRPIGGPRPVQHFHQPRLRAAAAAGATNDVAAGHLYVTLTSSAGNIWMLDR